MMGKIIYSITAVAFTICIAFLVVYFLEMNENSKNDLVSCQPYNMQVSDVKNDSVLITWETEEKCSGRIKYDTQEEDFEYIVNQLEESKSNTHSVNIDGLLPNTKYYFIIQSDSDLYADNDLPLEFKTSAL